MEKKLNYFIARASKAGFMSVFPASTKINMKSQQTQTADENLIRRFSNFTRSTEGLLNIKSDTIDGKNYILQQCKSFPPLI